MSKRIASALSTLVLTALLAGFASPAGAAAVDPIERYGSSLEFDVIRNDTAVGTHRIDFRRDGDDVIVETRFDLTLTVLTLPIYRFLYTSVERWRGDALVSLDATTDDDGTVSRTVVSAEENGLVIDGPSGQISAPKGTYPTTHWNNHVIGADRVINTITGALNAVTITDEGVDTVDTAAGPLAARHYAYRGDLTTDVWYDDAGRWVKMRFAGKDGTMITYRCKTCAPAPLPQTGAADSSELARH